MSARLRFPWAVLRAAAPLVLAGLLGASGLATPANATPFTFTTYDGMVSELQDLAATYPGLTELFTAQDAWSLPTIPNGAEQLENWILRITNESLGTDKPEVLLVGVQHGDEVVGLEVNLTIARLLLENYVASGPGRDPWLAELVDRREIYLVPLANPHGFRNNRRWSPGGEGGSEDMNRDHLYDRTCGFGCDDEEALSTVGAQAIHELARRHLFRVMLDYHGGVEVIIHPWGTPIHNSDAESPDDRAHELLGLRMSAFGGSFNGFYPVGTSNELLGAVIGPLDDTSYATGWDPGNADAQGAETPGWRSLAYTVEISNQKKPPVSTLGGDADLLTPGGSEDGYVPKNVRIGLAAIDLIEPYVVWTNRDQLPSVVAPGDPVVVEWQVRGCFQVDETRVRFGTSDDPRVDFTGQTAMQQQTTGEPCWQSPTEFFAEVTFTEPGTYYLTPVAKVDSTLLTQSSPVPSLSPRSWLVRSRTEDGVLATNTVDAGEVSTVVAQTYWGAAPLAIEVGDPVIFSDGFESGATNVWTLAQP